MMELAYILFMFGSSCFFIGSFERMTKIVNVLSRIGSSSFFIGTLTLWIGG